jgi:hypothetical protein
MPSYTTRFSYFSTFLVRSFFNTGAHGAHIVTALEFSNQIISQISHLVLTSSSLHLHPASPLENIVSHSLNCIHVYDVDSDLFSQAAATPRPRHSTILAIVSRWIWLL